MKLEDYMKKLNEVNHFGNLGAINAAVKAATIFEEPSYLKSLRELNVVSGFLKDYSRKQNILKDLGGISSTLQQARKITELSGLAKSFSETNKFYKPDHFSFLTGSLKGDLSEAYRKADFLSNFKNPIAIPETYRDNISKIVSNNNSIFEGLNSITKTLSANSLFQSQVLSKYSLASLNATLAETIRNQNWEDVETIEDLTDEINGITSEAVSSGTMDGKSLEAIEKTLNVILEKLNAREIADDRKRFLSKLLNIIAVVGFLISLIAFYLQLTDHGKEEVIAEIKDSEKRIIDTAIKAIEIASKKRMASAKVNLRLKPSKTSSILATVEIGQEVSVISVNHKWILICYKNPDSGILVTGWAYKKYFDKL